ncbi:MAG: putative B9 protein domain 1 [Streblomastix strix]|uniref:B9 domain-containing protein 1 n=1 Tax=Streblomastix strix TaxID=222440 RepID=A0A5J4WDM6_9EUKA|nr:MAG: putative B9 protein domain 1 [Streblomastix strix]
MSYITGADSVHAHYSFQKGENWELINGIEEGVTQMGSKSSAGENRNTVVWNFPIEAQFSSSVPSGWPQLIVSVYGLDLFGRDQLIGTGAIHLPTGPGSFERLIPLFRPRDSSLFQKIYSFITGSRPEFVDPLFPATTMTRYVARTTSEGHVRVIFNVVLRNMSVMGFSISGEEFSM